MRRSSLLLTFCSGVVLLVLGLCLAVKAQNGMPGQQPTSDRMIDHPGAIDVLRIINTAEYHYRQDHGSYGSWPQLYASGAIGQVQRAVNRWASLPITDGEQVVPGYFLHLLVSRDPATYSVSLHESGSNDCGFSVFSDESGLIYQGAVIDCPQVDDSPDRFRRPR